MHYDLIDPRFEIERPWKTRAQRIQALLALPDGSSDCDELDPVAADQHYSDFHIAVQHLRGSCDRVEHRLHVVWRAGDDLEDGGGRRLPLQRLARLVVRPLERALPVLARGDVGDRTDQPPHASGFATFRHGAVLDPAVPTGSTLNTVLVLELLYLALEVARHHRAIRGKVLRMNPRTPDRRRELAALDRKERLGAIGQVQLAGFDVPVVNALGGRLRGERIL